MARSTFSLGMFSFLDCCMSTRKRGLVSGSGPLSRTAMVICLPSFVKTRAILPHRFILVAFLYSNALPISICHPGSLPETPSGIQLYCYYLLLKLYIVYTTLVHREGHRWMIPLSGYRNCAPNSLS